MHLRKISFVAVLSVSNHFLNGEEIFVRYNGFMMVLLPVLVTVMVITLGLMRQVVWSKCLPGKHIPTISFVGENL